MISIIIPAYNEENYIEDTLLSVKKQNFKDYEIIVVCNGCIDNTSKIAKKYADKVLNIKEKSAPLARNKGASIAKYNKLFFLDADTRLKNKNLLNKIANKNIELGTCLFLPNNNKIRFKIFALVKNLTCKFGIANGNLICDKKLFNKINGFNENLFPGENGDLIKRMKKYSKFKIIPYFVITSMRRHKKLGFSYALLYWIKIFFLKRKYQYEVIR